MREAGASEKGDQQAESQQINAQASIGEQSDVSSQEQENAAGVGSSSPTTGSGSGSLSGDQRGSNSDDMDGLSSGNDSGERDSEGRMARGGTSCGHQSTRSSRSHSSSNGKDSGVMLETTESHKRYEENGCISFSCFFSVLLTRSSTSELNVLMLLSVFVQL